MELNTTTDYHANRLDSLGWELTVCNALDPENSPIRKILEDNDSYGHLLYKFLRTHIPADDCNNIVEIGGGYGCLMRAFFDFSASMKAMMIDISPYLLARQRETLNGCDAVFKEEDFLQTDAQTLEGFDLAIMNENLGDFPTLINLYSQALEFSGCKDMLIREVRYFFDRYSLTRPSTEPFNFNLGGLKAVEKLCVSGIPYIFLGEHSCEASAPSDLNLPIQVKSARTPEKISLKGHDEYSVQFSYLQCIGESFGYRCVRGPFADFIRVKVSDSVRHAVMSGGRASDDAEIVCQFVEDLYKYEYLIFIKSDQ